MREWAHVRAEVVNDCLVSPVLVVGLAVQGLVDRLLTACLDRATDRTRHHEAVVFEFDGLGSVRPVP